MKRLLVLLIIISVTPWAYPQQGNSAKHWVDDNDNCTMQTQESIANFAITTIEGDGNYSTIVQY